MSISCRFITVSRIVLPLFVASVTALTAYANTVPSKQAVHGVSGRVSSAIPAARPAAGVAIQSKQAVRPQAAAPAPRRAAAPASVSHAQRMGLRQVSDPLNLNSSAALIIDADTHEILLGKNDTVTLPVASLTKLMTGLIIAEAGLPMNQRIVITRADIDRLKNSGSRLAVGARLTRQQALHVSLMSSENRAAHALARTYPGGVTRFVERMNQKAHELGMMDTRFVDPTGLSSGNQSSARDIAILAAATYEVPLIRKFTVSSNYSLPVGNHRIQYRNSNRLVERDAWDIGLQKTGFIREAGRCVVMQVNVAGRNLIMVLLDANNNSARTNDAERMRRWAERTLYSNSFAGAGQS